MRHVMQGEHCNSWLSKCVGLMFAAKPRTLFFHFTKPKIIHLHMLFVRFPIDVILLDSASQIVEIRESLAPWSFFSGKAQAACAIECLAGTVRRLGLKLGDKLECSS